MRKNECVVTDLNWSIIVSSQRFPFLIIRENNIIVLFHYLYIPFYGYIAQKKGLKIVFIFRKITRSDEKRKELIKLKGIAFTIYYFILFTVIYFLPFNLITSRIKISNDVEFSLIRNVI